MTIVTTPLTGIEQVVSRIADLQTALQTAAPNYESLLHVIHVALSKDEELAHLLTEEQVGVICSGLAKKKNIVIAATTAKSRSSSGKKLGDVTLDDL